MAWLAGSALLVGGFAHLAVAAAARLARTDWKVLTLGLVPRAAANLFLGLSMSTLTQLRSEGIVFSWLPQASSDRPAGGAGHGAAGAGRRRAGMAVGAHTGPGHLFPGGL